MSTAIKAPIPSHDLIQAALAVFTARAGVETLRPVIEEIQTKLLSSHPIIYVNRFAVKFPDRFPTDSRRSKQLTSFDDAAELPDDLREHLYILLETAYVEAGFVEARPVGHCPFMQARSLERRAAAVFIEGSAELGAEFADTVKLLDDAGLEKRASYVELALRFVSQFINEDARKSFLPGESG